MGVSADIM